MSLQRPTDDPQLQRLLASWLGCCLGPAPGHDAAEAPPLAALLSPDFSGVAGAGRPPVRDGDVWLARARLGLVDGGPSWGLAAEGADVQELGEGLALATLRLHAGPDGGAGGAEGPAARLILAVRREAAGWRVRHADLAVSRPATPPPAEAGLHAVADAADAAGLTAREAEVLGLLREGRFDREIAECLGISPRTVQKHVERVLAKMGARSRLDAVRRIIG